MCLDQKIGRSFQEQWKYCFEFFETECSDESKEDFSPLGFYAEN